MRDSQFSATGLVLLGELAKINQSLDIFNVNNTGIDELNKVLYSTNHSRLRLQQSMEDVGEPIERKASVSIHSQDSQVRPSVLRGASASKDVQLSRSFFETGHSYDGIPAEIPRTTASGSTQSQTRKRNHRKTPSNAIDRLFQGLS